MAAPAAPSPGEGCSPGRRAGRCLTSWCGRAIPNCLGRAKGRPWPSRGELSCEETRSEELSHLQRTARRGGRPAKAPARGEDGGSGGDGGCCGVTWRAGAGAAAGALLPARSGDAGITVLVTAAHLSAARGSAR